MTVMAGRDDLQRHSRSKMYGLGDGLNKTKRKELSTVPAHWTGWGAGGKVGTQRAGYR